MSGITTLLDIGRLGLFASQVSISTVGNNIANVDNPDYARRTVRLEEMAGLNTRPGQIGQGVDTREVIRHFDQFIESAYNDKAADTERWNRLFENLRGVDSLLNESQGQGLSSSLNKFFADWHDLSLRPDSYPSRQALLSDTQNLVSVLHQTDASLGRLQKQADATIMQDVDEANALLREIAKLNVQLNVHDVPGHNNANDIYDKRAALVRKLAIKLNIKTIDNGGGNLTILTQAGQTLLDGTEPFRLAFEGAQSQRRLVSSSTYQGDVAFQGSDNFEYQIRVMHAGSVSSNASDNSVARFEVSFDGGRSWDRGDDGKGYLARSDTQKLRVRNVEIGFTMKNDAAHPEYDQLAEGDVFNVVPKSGLYWYRNSSTKENITPQLYGNGSDNLSRVSGGSLGGFFNFRDNYVGKYIDQLDGLAKSLTWEVNRLHSQGVGLTKSTLITGAYSVNSTDLALGSNTSGLAFFDRLNSGNVTLYVYDKATHALVSNAALDFSSASGVQNFDPKIHSLASAAAAVNRSFNGLLTAKVVNNQLTIEAASGHEFAVGADTAGLFAGLGLNVFFTGSNSRDLDVDVGVAANPGRLATGHVNGAAEANVGDNTTAVAIAALQTGKVKVTTLQDGTQQVNLQQFYNSLITEIGADTENAQFNHAFQKALADDLNSRQKQVSGVNLDQEMADLIRFQHSYTAAAKMISTADQMLQTLLGLKQ